MLEEQHENLDKMRTASGHQYKVKMRGSDISSIKRVPKKFLEVLRCSCAKQWQRIVQKKCAASAKLLFLIRPIVVFHRFSSVACLRRLALHDFVFCLNEL